MVTPAAVPSVYCVQSAVADGVKAAVQRLADLGAGVVEVSIPNLDQHCASYYVNVLSEASANLARYDGTRYGLRKRESGSAKSVMLDSRAEGFGEVRQPASRPATQPEPG